jgi:hypothetical protein
MAAEAIKVLLGKGGCPDRAIGAYLLHVCSHTDLCTLFACSQANLALVVPSQSLAIAHRQSQGTQSGLSCVRRLAERIERL